MIPRMPRRFGLMSTTALSLFAVTMPSAFCLPQDTKETTSKNSASIFASLVAKSPLSAAKTVQLKETFLMAGQDGKLAPFFDINVKIAPPGQVFEDANPIAVGLPKTVHHSLYVLDNGIEHDFNGFGTHYITSDLTKSGTESKSQLRAVSKIDMLLGGGSPPKPSQGVKRSVAKVTLEGHEVVAISDTQPARTARDGSMVTVTEKYWNDAKTGLPYRWAVVVSQGAKTRTVQQINFTDWSLDKEIAPAQFVWNAPEGTTEEPKPIAVGVAAPDFAVTALDGKTTHLSDYKGKLVVIDFWSTWCGPCQQSMPHLEKVYQQVKEKGVTVLAVCVWDDKVAYDKWVIEKKSTYTFPTFFDPAGKGDNNIAAGQYGVTGIPTQFVLDKDGKVAAVNVGYEPGEARLESELAALGVDISIPKKTASIK